MISKEKQIIVRVIENFLQSGNIDDSQVTVTLLPDNKTSYVEQTGEDSRSVMLDEYHFFGKTIWAGYSYRSGIVYLSQVPSH